MIINKSYRKNMSESVVPTGKCSGSHFLVERTRQMSNWGLYRGVCVTTFVPIKLEKQIHKLPTRLSSHQATADGAN
jgi:hypothetical protein